jgi:hypothetical protein
MQWKAHRETEMYNVAAVMIGYGELDREEYRALKAAMKERFDIRIRLVGSIPSRDRESDLCFLVHKTDAYKFRRGRWVGHFEGINYLSQMSKSDYPGAFTRAYGDQWE